MKKILHIILFLLAGTICSSGGNRDKGIEFVYDIHFEMNFDNREYYESAFSSSMTIFGARLTPAVGLSLTGKDGTSHRIMTGIDIMKDFGASPAENVELFREITLYYNLEKDFGDTDMSIYAGIFPRRKMEGRYSQAFFSDSLRFYDNNLEGLLVKFRRPRAYFEAGCDWMGQYGDNRRERFMIYSSGEGLVAPSLTFGYSGYMYHFANSRQVKGLVDNILINPYARLDLAHLTGLQTLSFTLGYLQAFQHNRKQVGHYVFPRGASLDIEVRKWDAAVRNMTFYGLDMMPYYNFHDAGGVKYGSELYLGDPFYRIHDNGDMGAGLYDRLEICYEPVIGKYLKMRIAALFHFHDFHYSGCQQVVGVIASF